MPGAPLNFLADPSLAAVGAQVEDRVQRWADSLDAASFTRLLDPLCRQALSGAFQWVGASEGTVWLADAGERHLVAAYNTGARAAELTGFAQPLDQGIISLVYANGQAYCENEIAGREDHDATLDRKMGARTGAMLAVPLHFGYRPRGVISCVQFLSGEGATLPGFSSRHVEEIGGAASLVERLINGRLLSAALGLEHA